MHIENRFNLIDEPWIPIVDAGKVSLKQIFSHPNLRAIGGNPVQKIALTKLLLAIAQAAYTPQDDEDWAVLGFQGVAKKCLAYLEKWHNRFWLYGEKPFLQMNKIVAAQQERFGAVLPEVATGNTTVLTAYQRERKLSDAEKAVLIVCLMGFALGGKKTDNSIVLTPGYKGKNNEKGKPSTGKPGPSIGYWGYLHSFVYGQSLQETIWLNLFTKETLEGLLIYPNGVGIAPWEKMPEGEWCDTAQSLQRSLMGRLVPLSRFCLLTESGLHYSEGIAHPTYKEGVVDPSVAVNFSSKEVKVIWTDAEKRPWRNLTSLLSFLSQSAGNNFDCYQIKYALKRARNKINTIGVWSGGIRVRSNAGEQYLSFNDDFVESQVSLDCNQLGELWYLQLTLEMTELEKIADKINEAVKEYFGSQEMDGAQHANKAINLFWQLCEHHFQTLIDACINTDEVKDVRRLLVKCAHKAYDSFCPKDTARQLDAWAENKPNFSQYLN